MHGDTKTQKQYFENAYKRGSDIWSHIPYHSPAIKMIAELAPNSLILDIGSGRGSWGIKLLEQGFRVLGIDYIESVTHQSNTEVDEQGYKNRARFVTGSALDIPFVEGSFDCISDIGTFQHLAKTDWEQYLNEIKRTLKPGGCYLNVSLCKETTTFMGWKPSSSQNRDFEKFGLNYHFFDEEEIEEVFGDDFTMLKHQSKKYSSQSDPHDDVVLLFSFMQKK